MALTLAQITSALITEFDANWATFSGGVSAYLPNQPDANITANQPWAMFSVTFGDARSVASAGIVSGTTASVKKIQWGNMFLKVNVPRQQGTGAGFDLVQGFVGTMSNRRLTPTGGTIWTFDHTITDYPNSDGYYQIVVSIAFQANLS